MDYHACTACGSDNVQPVSYCTDGVDFECKDCKAYLRSHYCYISDSEDMYQLTKEGKL